MALRVTMKEVAARAGVHKSTVSLALRGHRSIPAETAMRIRQIAEEMGYRNDPALSVIAGHRWNSTRNVANLSLAYIIPTVDGTSANALHYVDGVRRRAEARGCSLDVMRMTDFPDGRALSRVLYSRGTQGVLIAPIAHTSSPIDLSLDWSKFSAVCCSVGWAQPLLHIVSYDVFFSAQRCWRELVRRGYRRIGPALFSHVPPAQHDFGRWGAILSEQRLHGNSVEQLPIFQGTFDDRDGFLEWFRQARPDAVLSFHPAPLYWLRSAGVRVPEEVGFAALQMRIEEGVCGMFTPPDQVAEVAVDLLISNIRDNDIGVPKLPRTLLIEPEWRDGPTLRPAPLTG